MNWIVFFVGIAIAGFFAFTDNIFNGGEVLGFVIMFAGWLSIMRNDIRNGL